MNRIWRYSVVLTGFIFPLLSNAQEAVASAPSAQMSAQQIWLIVTGVLLLLFAVSTALLFFYRKRYLWFLTRCDELEPALKKTREKLEDVSQDLQKTVRKANEDNYVQEQLLREAGAAIFKLNKEGVCSYVNTRMEQLIGLPLEMVAHEGLINSVHPEDREQVQAEWSTFAERDVPSGSVYRLLAADGRITYVLCRGSTLRDGLYNVTGYLGILMDITAQVNECAEHQTLEARSRYFAQEISGGFYELRPDQPVSVELPPKELAEKIYQTMSVFSCNSVLAEMCGSSVKELTGARLSSLADGCGIFENADRVREFIAAGFKMLGIERVRKDRRGNPVYLRNDAVGMVENGLLVSIWGSQHDISRHKREIEELNGRVGFLGSVLDTLPADVFVKDTRCRFLYVSRGFSERTGIPAEDWIEKTIFELMPGTPRSVNKNSIEVMKTGEMRRTVDSYQSPDGMDWRETFEAPLASADGLIEGVVGLSIDVTERTRKELELQRAEKQFRALAENGPVGILVAEAESKKLTYVNPVLCDFLGYTEEELLTMRIGDFHSPGSRRQVLAEWDERARNRRRFETALPCLRKDRSTVFAEVGISVEQVDGQDLFVAVYSDASGRKKMEEELTAQCEYHAGLIRNAAALVAVVNSDGTVRSINCAAADALGYDADELSGKPFASLLVSEPDRTALLDVFLQCGSGTESACECRFSARSGEMRIAACRIRPLMSKEGALTAFSVVGVDITEHRKQEEQLQRRCDQLRDHLEQSSADLLQMTGKQKQSELMLEQTTAELKRLEGTLADRTERFEKDLAERAALEAELRSTLDEMKKRKTSLEKTVEQRQSELLLEAERRRKLEVLLEESRNAFSRDQQTFSNLVEHRTKLLEQELERFRKQAAEQAEENAALSQRRVELEAELAERTKELEAQVAGRKAGEAEFGRMSDELKAAAGGDNAALARRIAECTAETDKAKAAEKELRQQEAALQQRIKDLEAELQRLGKNLEADHRMVAQLNDDAYASLVPVFELSEAFLRDNRIPDEERRQFAEIHHNSRHLMQIMNYRLELAHLDAGAIRVSPETFDLQTLMAELDKEFSVRAKSRGLFFAFSCSGTADGTVYADREKVGRVLRGLLEHALAVTAGGQLGVHVVSEEQLNGRKQVSFQLMYNGLDSEKAVLAEVLSPSGTQKEFGEMTDAEMQLDIIRRQAVVLGGSVRLGEHPGRKPVVTFTISFGKEPDGLAVSRQPFSLRVTQIARPQSAYVIEVKGALQNRKPDVGYQILIEDRTGGKRSPIRFENGESESDVAVVETLEINSPPVKVEPDTTLSDWTVVAKLPKERLQFARKGQRLLNFKVRVRNAEAVGEQDVTADQHESGFVEIRERLPDMYEAIWHLIQGLHTKFPEYGEKIVSGSADFLIKEAVGWTEDEQRAIFSSFKRIVETKSPTVTWEEACASHSALLREFANTGLRNGIIRLFFMLLIDETGMNADAQTSIPVFHTLCVGIGADMSTFTRLVDRFLMEHDLQEVPPECLLGLNDGMTAREAKNRVMEEYKKWNSRVTHSDAAIRARARRMLEMISQVRAELKAGKKYRNE